MVVEVLDPHFKPEFGTTMENDVAGDTSGSYQKLLLALCKVSSLAQFQSAVTHACLRTCLPACPCCGPKLPVRLPQGHRDDEAVVDAALAREDASQLILAGEHRVRAVAVGLEVEGPSMRAASVVV